MSSEGATKAPAPLRRARIAVTGAVVLLMAAIGYVAEVVADFVAYPTCESTPPPGPPGFLLASFVITLVCGTVPALVVGVRRRRAALVAFALGAVVPFGLACYVASHTGHGFCI